MAKKYTGINRLKEIFGYIKGKFDALATVARTGSYNDLTNKPSIPSDVSVKDYNNNIPTKFGYSTSGMSSASWIGAWDASTSGEYRLRAISPQALRNTMGLGNTTGALPIANGGTGATTAANARTNLGAVNKAGDTMTGALNFANGTKNVVGDDASIGDLNVAGTLGVIGENGTTAIALLKRGGGWNTSNSRVALTWNGQHLNTSEKASISGDLTVGVWDSSYAGTYCFSQGYMDSGNNRRNRVSGKGSSAQGGGCHADASFAHAEGNHTTSYGKGSHAEGNYTTAYYGPAHAEGDYTTAYNNGAHAEGVYTKASDDGAHAEGRETRASGTYSHAEGYNTGATGNYAHSEGDGSAATSFASHAEGYTTLSKGWASHAEGIDTSAEYDGAHSEGIKTHAYAKAAHAEGFYTEAHAEASHASGYKTYAEGLGSFAHGYLWSDGSGAEWQDAVSLERRRIYAEGRGSFAGGFARKGQKLKAGGDGSFAFGYVDSCTINKNLFSGGIYAEGDGSLAGGYCNPLSDTTPGTGAIGALGRGSFSWGYNTKAREDESQAFGLGTIANGQGQMAIGVYNAANEYDKFIIGDGASDSSRRSIFSIDTNGNIYGYNRSSGWALSIGNYGIYKGSGTASVYGDGGNGISISQNVVSGETSGIHMGGNYITMWSPADDYTIRYVDEDNGNYMWSINDEAYFDGSCRYANSSSDKRLKHNINYIDETNNKDIIDFINSLKPATFAYNDDAKGTFEDKTTYEGTERIHHGLIAQDVEAAIDNSVLEDHASFTKRELFETIKEKDEDGKLIRKEKKSLNDYEYLLNYSEFVSDLIVYCQHLNNRVQELERRLGK